MTGEAVSGSKKGRKSLGGVLVVLGALTIVQGLILAYSPSSTDEDNARMAMWFVASIILGFLLVIFGWILLRKKGG
jgi:cytochrome bd-type quinol oxidase subunit 1